MIAIRTGSVAPIGVTFDGQPLQNMGLCTRLSVHQSVIAQFQNTFDSYIYITPFGDKPGEIAFTFIVNRECDGAQDVLNAIDFYIRRRLLPTHLSVQNNTLVWAQTAPIIVAVGSLTMRGFVTGLDIDGTTENTVIIQATLRMTGWPI
jgi:hypothetical protein